MTKIDREVILVCYGVDECPPFAAMQESLHELALMFEQRLEIQYVDAWEDPDSIVRLGILSLPATVLYVDGEPRIQLQGFHWPDQLAQKIASALGEGEDSQWQRDYQPPGRLKRLLRGLWPQLRTRPVTAAGHGGWAFYGRR